MYLEEWGRYWPPCLDARHTEPALDPSEEEEDSPAEKGEISEEVSHFTHGRYVCSNILVSEQVDQFREDWEEVEALDVPLPVRGRVTVVEGRTGSSINGQVAWIEQFSGVHSRARFIYGVSQNTQKVPVITKLEKGSDGAYRFFLLDRGEDDERIPTIWRFEPEVNRD